MTALPAPPPPGRPFASPIALPRLRLKLAAWPTLAFGGVTALAFAFAFVGLGSSGWLRTFTNARRRHLKWAAKPSGYVFEVAR